MARTHAKTTQVVVSSRPYLTPHRQTHSEHYTNIKHSTSVGMTSNNQDSTFTNSRFNDERRKAPGEGLRRALARASRPFPPEDPIYEEARRMLAEPPIEIDPARRATIEANGIRARQVREQLDALRTGQIPTSGSPIPPIENRTSSLDGITLAPDPTIEHELLQMKMYVYVPDADDGNTETWHLATDELRAALSARMIEIIGGKDYVKKVHARAKAGSNECIISSTIGRRECTPKRMIPETACATCVRKGRTCAVFMTNDAGIGFFPVAETVASTEWNDISRYCSNDR